jgi:hypothetical protein
VATISMSKREFDRLEVLLGVQSGRLRVADVCTLTGLSRRQVFRLLQGLRAGGAASLVSKRRGRRSNRQMPDEVRQLAVTLVRERYSDFGPTLAAEKLAELHGCRVSRETLRQWMIADGIWTAYSDETSHRFRSKPATCSEANQPGIPMMPAGVAVGFADGFIELGGRVVRQA